MAKETPEEMPEDMAEEETEEDISSTADEEEENPSKANHYLSKTLETFITGLETTHQAETNNLAPTLITHLTIHVFIFKDDHLLLLRQTPLPQSQGKTWTIPTHTIDLRAASPAITSTKLHDLVIGMLKAGIQGGMHPSLEGLQFSDFPFGRPVYEILVDDVLEEVTLHLCVNMSVNPVDKGDIKLWRKPLNVRLTRVEDRPGEYAARKWTGEEDEIIRDLVGQVSAEVVYECCRRNQKEAREDILELHPKDERLRTLLREMFEGWLAIFALERPGVGFMIVCTFAEGLEVIAVPQKMYDDRPQGLKRDGQLRQIVWRGKKEEEEWQGEFEIPYWIDNPERLSRFFAEGYGARLLMEHVEASRP